MGRGPYERLRARAITLLLRRTALRISDVAGLEKNRIHDGQIFLRTAKNAKPVKLPLHPDLQPPLRFSQYPGAPTRPTAILLLEWPRFAQSRNPRLHSNYGSRIQGVCCKHVAKWSRSRQARISELLGRIWYTKIWYTKKLVRKWKKTKRIILVDEMGFEPTTPALRTPCSHS